jgi:hypothetical protein
MKLAKGDYQAAAQVLYNGQSLSAHQFQQSAAAAQAAGLIEFTFDVDGGYYVATDKFNKMADQFSGQPAQATGQTKESNMQQNTYSNSSITMRAKLFVGGELFPEYSYAVQSQYGAMVYTLHCLADRVSFEIKGAGWQGSQAITYEEFFAMMGVSEEAQAMPREIAQPMPTICEIELADGTTTQLVDGHEYDLGATIGTYKAKYDTFSLGGCFVGRESTRFAGDRRLITESELELLAINAVKDSMQAMLGNGFFRDAEIDAIMSLVDEAELLAAEHIRKGTTVPQWQTWAAQIRKQIQDALYGTDVKFYARFFFLLVAVEAHTLRAVAALDSKK